MISKIVPDPLLILFTTDPVEQQERRAFPTVVAMQDGSLIETTVLIRCHGKFRQGISIDGHMMFRIHPFQQFFRGHPTQFIHRRNDKPQLHPRTACLSLLHGTE